VADEDEGGKRMTLAEHLEELRSRLVRCLLAVTVGFILTFIWIEQVMAFLRRPLDPIVEKHQEKIQLIQTHPAGAFIASMKIAFFAGLILASPYILHHLWAFVAAGLYRHERRSVKYYAVPGFLLFFAGAALAYFFILPWALDFLIDWAIEETGLSSLLTLNSYVSLVAWSMFVFGLMFQLPLVMVFLMRLGVVEPATFRRYRRHAIVTNFAIAMILTPPDVITQVALAGCMTLLYEGAVLVGERVAQERRPEA
jgi:sec-independent protein translocase protein TatC